MAGNRRARGDKPPRRPDPEPLEVDEALVIAVGTVAWFVAWVGLLAFHGKLEDHGNEWWIWTAVAGLGLGMWGWLLVRKRMAARNAARSGEVPRGSGRRRRAVRDQVDDAP
jgi:hypothetical protein